MSSESLFEQATSLGSLLRATRRASLGKRGRAEVACFLMEAEKECLALEGRLRLEPDNPLAWRPAPGRARWIRDPKPRRIVVIPFPDRVVHHALCRVAEPFFERYAVSRSYASRVGKGQVRAIEAARRIVRGHSHVLKADVLAFFASIPHDRLIVLIRRLLPDPRLLEIFTRIIHDYQASPGRGLPIGSLCSQSFANLYLGRLDHHLMDQLGVRAYVRYMDDMLVGGDREGLRAIREEMRRFLDEKLGLALNPKVTRILPASVGVPFLGLRVCPRGVRLLRSTVDRFRQRLAWIDEALREGRIDQEEAAARASSVFAHVERFQSPAERLAILERLGSCQGWRLTSEPDTDP